MTTLLRGGGGKFIPLQGFSDFIKWSCQNCQKIHILDLLIRDNYGPKTFWQYKWAKSRLTSNMASLWGD